MPEKLSRLILQPDFPPVTKVCLATRVIGHMDQGLRPQEAADKALDYMYRRVGGSGGLILVDKHGRYVVCHVISD